jgi:hypothetical protein
MKKEKWILRVSLRDTADQVRVCMETPNSTRDSGIDWDFDSPYTDSVGAMADTVRNHVLGFVADMNWEYWLKQLTK